MEAIYQIAQIQICIHAPFSIEDNEAFRIYRKEELDPTLETKNVYFEEIEQFPAFEEMELIYKGDLNLVYQNQNEYYHAFHLPFRSSIACFNKLHESKLVIYYKKEFEEYFHTSVGCFNALSIEEVMHEYARYIFHCCYVETNQGAILFTAPSTGGKTTQGMLWEASGKGKIINGDRCVILEQDGKYSIHGLPIAGSSGVFIDKTNPLKAIFIVKKAKENKVYPVKGMKAFSQIYQQFLMHTYDKSFQIDVLDYVEKLLGSIPVYILECTIDQEAVNIVNQLIQTKQ